MTASFAPMLKTARALLAKELNGPADDIVRQLLDATKTDLPERTPVVSHSSARRHLAQVQTAGLGPAVADLNWYYGYDGHSDLARDVAFADLVGPDGPLVRSSVRLGLTLIGPEILYPDHHHPAAELYLVISGTADWSANGGPFVRHGPGAAILHPSGVAHAMRTGPEVLLALFGWTGAIDIAPVYT